MPVAISSADLLANQRRRDTVAIDFAHDTSNSVTSRKRRSDCFYLFSKNAKMTSPLTLREFLKKKSRVVAFRSFLLEEFSEENLDFWIEVEAYRKQKAAKQAKLAPAIFDTYLRVGAPREVNVDAVARKTTLNNLTSPDASTFDLAQGKVHVLMERDPFRRFLVKGAGQSRDKVASPKAKSQRKSVCLAIDTKDGSSAASKLAAMLQANVTERRRRNGQGC